MSAWSKSLQAYGCPHCRPCGAVFLAVLVVAVFLLAASGPARPAPAVSKREVTEDTTTSSAKEVAIQTGTLIMSKTGKRVFYQYASGRGAGGACVLLLHGAAFSSQTWRQLGTLAALAAAGHTAVAIDLPGFGKSPSHGKISKETFIPDVVDDLKNESPALACLGGRIALVTPSMSGQYALPLLAARWPALSALVAVAPVGSGVVTSQVAEAVQIPALVVRGSLDTTLGLAAERALSRLPAARILVLEGAGHPAYLHDPQRWHRELLAFLQQVQSAAN